MSIKKFSMRVNANDDFDTPMGLEDDLADYNQNEANDYLHEDERIDQNVEEQLYVNVYDVQQNFGGSEEGGWYYDSGRVVESNPVNNGTEADILKNNLEDKYLLKNKKPFGSIKLNNPDQEIPDNWESTSQADDESYVHSEGEICVVIEDHPAKDFPETRPYYE